MPLPTASADEVREAARTLMGFYPAMDASDPQIFTTGLVQLFSSYSRPTVVRAPNAIHGLPGLFKRMPSIAEIREQMEKWEEYELTHHERQERWRHLQLTGPERESRSSGPGAASRSQLCERYGISDVPGTWDAIDIVRMAHQHGDRLPAVIDGILTSGRMPGPVSVMSRVLDHARVAMEERIARGDPISSRPLTEGELRELYASDKAKATRRRLSAAGEAA